MMSMSVRENSNETGRLHLDFKKLAHITSLNASVIDISPRFSSERENVETFICDTYYKHYNACINVAYPVLMSVRNDAGKILAATGFRCAALEALFLEHYTGTPIERALSGLYARAIPRHEIAEIGNLASSGSGASIFLFAALASYLDRQGIHYATITGAEFLRRRLGKIGLKPQVLCNADISYLPPAERELWGTYYDTKPRVMSGTVSDGVSHFQKELGVIYEDRRPPLHSRLHFKEKT